MKAKKINNYISLLSYLISNGIVIPHYCYHNNLSIAGNCRVCLVELKNSVKPVVSCATNAKASLYNNEIYFDSPLVKKARENILEFLLLNHPLDCPICDQGGDCDLQDQSLLFGGPTRRFYKYKRVVSDKNIGPLVKTIMTRCIHCTRCIRFMNEVSGIEELGIFGRGVDSEIGTYLDKSLSSELSGNLIDICPVSYIVTQKMTLNKRQNVTSKTRNFVTIKIIKKLTNGLTLLQTGHFVFILFSGYKFFAKMTWQYQYVNWANLITHKMLLSQGYIRIPEILDTEELVQLARVIHRTPSLQYRLWRYNTGTDTYLSTADSLPLFFIYVVRLNVLLAPFLWALISSGILLEIINCLYSKLSAVDFINLSDSGEPHMATHLINNLSEQNESLESDIVREGEGVNTPQKEKTSNPNKIPYYLWTILTIGIGAAIYFGASIIADG